jgi:hypothetical protein
MVEKVVFVGQIPINQCVSYVKQVKEDILIVNIQNGSEWCVEIK